MQHNKIAQLQPAQEITGLPNSRKRTATVLVPARTRLILFSIQEAAWLGPEGYSITLVSLPEAGGEEAPFRGEGVLVWLSKGARGSQLLLRGLCELFLSCTFCHYYCCYYCSFCYLIAVSIKFFLSQPVIFALFASNSLSRVLQGMGNWE